MHKCPFCRATPVTGHEAHYLLACPSVTPAIEPMYKPIKENLKRLALPPWDGLDDNVKISLLLGSSLPPQLDKRKAMRDQWLSCTQNYCSLIALKLSSMLSFTSPTTIQLINHRRQPKPQIALPHYTLLHNLFPVS